jgi:organic radical activating enzyme
MSRSAARPVASVAEVFRSWQGEGLLLGRRQVFVRLAGCDVGCRYCDTAWAFDAPADVAVPGRPGERAPNPMDAGAVLALVRAAEGAAGPGAIALTGGEPLEQPDFVDALLDALAPREVMLRASKFFIMNGSPIEQFTRWPARSNSAPHSSSVSRPNGRSTLPPSAALEVSHSQ